VAKSPVNANGMSETNRPPITHIVVAVPARDEADTVADCLASIDAAAASAGVPILVVVAADSCTDNTVARARAMAAGFIALEVISGSWAGAGAARAAAVTTGLNLTRGVAESIWIANTDADTVVPEGWFVEQLRLASHFDAVAGVVDLDPLATCPHLLNRFRSTYQLDGGTHRHVHGANLGVRCDAYLDVGGWCPNTLVGEDHRLWNRLKAQGHDVIQCTHVRVTTSARVRSRVEGGFATDLRALAGVTTARSTDEVA
jgi:cellulose synthase/poly-beta-1,6-N-acetylglucosamine synthase-like glycosyltransferase